MKLRLVGESDLLRNGGTCSALTSALVMITLETALLPFIKINVIFETTIVKDDRLARMILDHLKMAGFNE